MKKVVPRLKRQVSEPPSRASNVPIAPLISLLVGLEHARGHLPGGLRRPHSAGLQGHDVSHYVNGDHHVGPDRYEQKH